MRHGNDLQREMIREAIEKANGMERLTEILQAMEETGSLEYTRQKALQEADKAIKALTILPESEYKQALIALSHLAVHRHK
jgi:octaprenyl-diphosphate synthase